MNRRTFLQNSTLAGSALAAGIGTLTIDRAAFAAGQERFRIGLVGCGGRGTGAAADCLRTAKHIKLVAMADAFREKMYLSQGQLKKILPDQVEVTPEQMFSGFDAYKQVLAAGVDLVLLTTPPGFRPMQYRAAVEAGKHVFMEKPLCVDPAGYRSVMESNKIADQKRLKIGVGMFRRHHPDYVRTMNEIHGGGIGEITYMRCYCNMSAWGEGRPRQPEMSEMEHQVRNWRCFSWLSGGRQVEAHCHELDVMDWAMKDHPVEANGIGGRHFYRGEAGKGRFGDDYDHHFNEYIYPNGVRMYSQCRQIDRCWDPITEHVHGVKGFRNLAGKIAISNAGSATIEKTNPYLMEHAHLLEAVWEGKPYNEGWSGATSSFTSILGREACYSGQVVKWDELAEKGGGTFPAKLAWDADPPVMPDKNGTYENVLAMPGRYKPF